MFGVSENLLKNVSLEAGMFTTVAMCTKECVSFNNNAQLFEKK